MQLRTKTLGIVALAVAGLGILVYFASSTIVTERFSNLENDQAVRNLDRLRQAVDTEVARLDSAAGDWAGWDDTYQFVQDGNGEYIDANLADDSLTTLRIDMMLFVNTEGQVVYAKAVDEDGLDAPLAAPTLDALTGSQDLVGFSGTGDSTAGIVTTADGGQLLVAARPVLTSDREGPIVGSFMMARTLDQRFVDELEAATKLSVEMFEPETNGEALAPDDNAIETLNSETLSASTVLAAVDGSAGIGLNLEIPRDVYAEGQKTLRYLLLSLLVIGLAFCVPMAILLETAVVNPVRNLSSFVTSVKGKLTMRAPQMGKDEIGQLGRSINEMLDSIETGSRELQRVNHELDRERQRVELLNQSLEGKVAERTKDLETANFELRDRNRELIAARVQAATDGLTCLGNHRSFQEGIREAIADPARERPLAVFMVDIDGFKQVNDKLGHQAGDRILVEVAQAFRESAGNDSVFRYGGDEFAVLAKVLSHDEALEIGERLRARVATDFKGVVTASVGVSLFPETASSAEEAIYQADSAMYKAKSHGKNQVQLWSPGVTATPSSAYSHLRKAATAPKH